jgi:hypothetical protein
MTHAPATFATALKRRRFHRFRLLWVLLLFIPLSISLTIYSHVSRYTAAVNKLALEQKTLNNLDIRLSELDKVIAEREQEAKSNEFESGHGKNLTPQQIKSADDQLARLKSQHERLRNADQSQRLDLYKKKIAQEVVVTKAERKVQEAHW